MSKLNLPKWIRELESAPWVTEITVRSTEEPKWWTDSDSPCCDDLQTVIDPWVGEASMVTVYGMLPVDPEAAVRGLSHDLRRRAGLLLDDIADMYEHADAVSVEPSSEALAALAAADRLLVRDWLAKNEFFDRVACELTIDVDAWAADQ